MALGVGLVWLGVVISRRVLSGRLVFLPSLLFLAFAYTSERDATHHWFSTFAVVAALAVLIEKRSLARLIVAGMLCGVATLFTQNRGFLVLLGIAASLIWEWRVQQLGRRTLLKNQAWLFAGFLATTVPVVTYLLWRVGFERLVYYTLVFPARFSSQYFWNSPRVYLTEVPLFPFWMEVPALGVWFFIHGLLPLVYLVFLARYWREARRVPEEPWDRLMLLSMVGLFMFLGFAFSPSWLRLCAASLPALILFTWFFKSPARLATAVRGFLWLFSVAVLVVVPWTVQTDWRACLDTPVGRAAIQDPDRYEKFRWVRAHTHAGDFLFQASDADLYFPLRLRNPTELSFLTPSGFTRPQQVHNVVKALDQHRVRFVLWSVWLDVPHPGHQPFEGERLAPIRNYLRTHYHVVQGFGSPDYEQVWQRND
jgi:hypothetical protein